MSRPAPGSRSEPACEPATGASPDSPQAEHASEASAGVAGRRPLPAEYVSRVHSDAKRAVGTVNKRRDWGNSRSGTPVATMMLCEEIARLQVERAGMLAALRDALWAIDNMSAIMDAEGLKSTLTDPRPDMRAAIAKAEGRS